MNLSSTCMVEDALVFHHYQISDSSLLSNTNCLLLFAVFVVSWNADCNYLLKVVEDVSCQCRERGWKQDWIQFHIFHADNDLDKLPQDIPYFPLIFSCVEKLETRTCHKYQSIYSVENLAFLVFSQLTSAFSEVSVRVESVDNIYGAVSFLKNRSSRFPYQQVAVMVSSQEKSWIDTYTKLFKQLAVQFIYVDFIIFSVADRGDNDDDNAMFQMFISYSFYEDKHSWRSFPVKDAIDVVTWRPNKKFLRWLRIDSPYSPFPPITPETYNNASKEDLFHFVIIPNRQEPQILDYEYLFWEFSMEKCQNLSLHSSNHSCRYYSMAYSSFEPFLKGLGVWSVPNKVISGEPTCCSSSKQAQVIIIDRQKEAWIRLPLYLFQDVSHFNYIYSILESLGEISGDMTHQVLQALSTYSKAPKLLSCIHKWTSREYRKDSLTVQQVRNEISFLHTLHGPAHLKQLWKANTKSCVRIIIFYVPWCIFCQQALPAYSYIANHVDQSLLGIYQYNCQQYDIPQEWDIWIDGFPTVLVFRFKHSTKPFIYEGPHTVEAITEYLQTRCLNKSMPLF